MEEQLITFETAKLAKEKGLKLYIRNLYKLDGKLLSNAQFDSSCIGYLAPTQSLLQKWLRETHNLHISIDFFIGGGSGFSEVYSLEIYNLEGTLASGNYVYDTYERALEEALNEALTLIKI